MCHDVKCDCSDSKVTVFNYIGSPSGQVSIISSKSETVFVAAISPFKREAKKQSLFV